MSYPKHTAQSLNDQQLSSLERAPSELATSRWVKKLTIEQIAREFAVGRSKVVAAVGRIKKQPDLVEDGSARKLVKLKERTFHGAH